MAGATIRIDQAANIVPTGVAGRARTDIWLSQPVSLVSTSESPPNTAWQWTMLDRPPGSGAALTNATTSAASFTPDIVGTYRIQLVAEGQTQIRIVGVVRTNAGVLVRRGWRMPALGEGLSSPNESNADGVERGYAPTMAGIFSDIDLALARTQRVVSVGPIGSNANYETDGTADEAQINAAITEVAGAGGGIVQLLPGEYVINSDIILGAKVHLRGSGPLATAIRISATWDIVANSAAIRAHGSNGGVINVSADVAKGANVVNVTTNAAYTALATNDYLTIISEDVWDPISSTSVRYGGEFLKVLDLSAGSFTLQVMSRGAYTIAKAARLYKANFMERVKVSDLSITQTGPKNTFNNIGSAILFCTVKGGTIENVRIHNWDGQGIGIGHSLNVNVHGCEVYNLTDLSPKLGYGVVVGGCSEGVIITGNHFSHCRHGYSSAAPRLGPSGIGGTYGIARAIIVANNHVSHCTSSGLDTHVWSEGVLIDGNTIENCTTWAIFNRAPGCLVKGNLIEYCGGGINTGIGRTSSGGTGSGTSVIGNHIRHVRAISTINEGGAVPGAGRGIQVLQTDNVTVADNVIEGVDDVGIALSIFTRRCVIRDNTIINANLLNQVSDGAFLLDASFNRTTGSISKSGTTCTWSYSGSDLNQGATQSYFAGQTVVISGSGTPANNGTFVITGINYAAPFSQIIYENASGANDASGAVTARIAGVTDCIFLNNLAINTTSDFDVGQTGHAKYLFRDLGVQADGGNTRNVFKGNTGIGMETTLFNQQNPLNFFAENSECESSPVKRTAAHPTDADFYTAEPALGTLAMNDATGELCIRSANAWDIVGGYAKSLANDFVTTVITPTNTNLQFPMKANEVWMFEIKLQAQCTTANGMKAQFNCPSGSTIAAFIEFCQTITSVFRQRVTSINALNASAFLASANVIGPGKLWGTVTCGATPGNFALAIAAVTGGDTCNVFKGSTLRAWKVVAV